MSGTARPARSPRIVIIDDNTDTRGLYGRFFAFAGWEVGSAEDGEDGLREVQRLQPDVIVLDVAMPRLDGRECARRLRGDPETRDIPIVVVTARALDCQLEPELFDAFLVKPCLPDQLQATIDALRSARKPRRSPGAA